MKLKAVLVLALALASSAVFAANTGTSTGVSTDLFVGPSFVNNGGGTNIDFGADVVNKFDPSWGVGLYFSYSGLGSSSGLNNTPYELTFAGELNYYLTGDLSGLYAGVKLGLGIDNSGVAGFGSANVLQLVVGSAIGYDYMLSTSVSVGLEANLLFYPGGTVNTTTNPGGAAVSYSPPGIIAFNTLARVGYHF